MQVNVQIFYCKIHIAMALSSYDKFFLATSNIVLWETTLAEVCLYYRFEQSSRFQQHKVLLELKSVLLARTYYNISTY